MYLCICKCIYECLGVSFFFYYLCIEMQWKPYAPAFFEKSPLCRLALPVRFSFFMICTCCSLVVQWLQKRQKKKGKNTPASNSIDNGFPRTCRLRYTYIYIPEQKKKNKNKANRDSKINAWSFNMAVYGCCQGRRGVAEVRGLSRGALSALSNVARCCKFYISNSKILKYFFKIYFTIFKPFFKIIIFSKI